MIKVVHIVTRINVGGLSTFLCNYYKNMDTSKIKFDVVAIQTNEKQSYHDLLVGLGCRVFYMPNNLFFRLLFLIKLFLRNKYDVAHSHIQVQSVFYLLISKFCGIKARIAHSHWSKENPGVFNGILKFLLNKIVSLRAGASELALQAVFGLRYSKKGVVIPNAIDLDEFAYSEITRQKYRADMVLENRLVVGYVGRLSYQKNIPFLLNVFSKLLHSCPEAMLMIIGDGEESDQMNKQIAELKLANNILWLKEREDVNQLLSVMDVLLLPSHFEGLPLVLVESQASSLHAIVSDYVTKLIDITPYIHYLPISKSSEELWVKLILELGNNYRRASTMDLLTQSHFNIKLEAENLYLLYKKLVTK